MDIEDIEEEIGKYYPVGTSDYDPVYLDSVEYQRLQNLLSQKEDTDVAKKWKTLLRRLAAVQEQVLAMEVISNHLYPCFSMELLLSQEKTQTVTYARGIQLHLSLIGPFFTVLGSDLVFLNQVQRYLDPLIYISPLGIYQKWFPLLRTLVGEIYPEYVFLPHFQWEARVTGLSVMGAVNYYNQEASVFQALFMPDNVGNYQRIGDDLYE